MVLMSFVRVTWNYLRKKYLIYVKMVLRIQMKSNKKSKKHIKIDISYLLVSKNNKGIIEY
jgi:hypothetical protein